MANLRLRYDSVIQRQEYSGGMRVIGGAGRPEAQLFNPAASGKLVIVYRCAAMHISATPDIIRFGTHDTALAGTAGIEIQKYREATPTVAVATLLGDTNAALLGTYGPLVSKDQYRAFEFIQRRPYILEEGRGIIVGIDTVGITLESFWEWEEVDT